MKKTLYFCLIQVLFMTRSILCISSQDEQHNNCLTWHDDNHAVFLQCRVSNISLPVTFYHERSNTKVVCTINMNEKHCIPKEKEINVNRYKNTVTVVLREEKLGRPLDGEWNCIQGSRIQTTEVSISKGIIIDSWILLRGLTNKSANKSNYIDLQCSSCRKPQGLYAEFLANGLTVGSVYQDDQGYCVHGQTVCSPNICNCTPTANMYSFRYEVKDVTTPIDFACDMQFSDNQRKGKFSITSRASYNGTDFSSKEYETLVIRNNTIVPIDDMYDYPSKIPRYQQSRFNLCFDWRVSANEQALNCRAHYLDHKIAIIDPVGITQAECVPPFSEMSCDTHNSNGTISQNRRTNETFYVLKGTIDYRLNGNWTCRHGKNLDSAKVEVTVFKPSGEKQLSKHPECLFTVFVSGCIFIVSAACAQIWLFCMLLIPENCTILGRKPFILEAENCTILGRKLFSLEAALGKCCRLPVDYQRKDDYIAILKRILFFICAAIYFIIINILAVGSNWINVFLPISGVFAGFICSLTCLGKKSTGNYSEFGNNQVILDNDIPLVEEETN